MFYSFPVPSKEIICAVAFCVGRDLFYLRKWCLYFEVLHLDQKPRRFVIPHFWTGLQELRVSILPRITGGST